MKKKPDNQTAGDLSRKAVARLNEHRKKTGPLPTSDVDIRRLVYELQLHQVELEMQNEELVQSRAELEELLRQYTNLYDFAPMGYFTLTPNSEIRQANLAGATLLGLERGLLIGRRFEVYVAASSQVTFKAFLHKSFTSGHKESCEITLKNNRPEPLCVYIEAALDEGQDEVCRAVVMDITQRKLAEEQLLHLSSHDALTGLYNRGFFMEEMKRLERGRNFPVSIMMADGDQLKDTNDRYGHAAGDDLLKRIAQALTSTFRGDDVIARIGGDEFAVLLAGTGVAEAEVLMQRLRQIIARSNAVNIEIPIRLSLSVSTAQTPAFLADILHEADINMYREKREHRPC